MSTVPEFLPGARLRLPHGSEFAGALNERSKNRLCENAQDIGDQARIVGQTVAESMRKREHPLPDRNSGENAVDQMGSGIGHPLPAARITKPSMLA